MKNKISILLKILGLVLIAGSLFLAGYNFITDYLAGVKSRDALEKILPVIEKRRIDEEKSYDPNSDMPTTLIDGYSYIGVITMESVGIQLPVLSEYSQSNLNIAPTRYKGSIYQDNAIIIAHNTMSHFKKIENLNIGDTVIFEDVNANVFQYEVIYTERISEKDIDLMVQGDWDLTLFTCSSNLNFRSTVRLKRLDKEI